MSLKSLPILMYALVIAGACATESATGSNDYMAGGTAAVPAGGGAMQGTAAAPAGSGGETAGGAGVTGSGAMPGGTGDIPPGVGDSVGAPGLCDGLSYDPGEDADGACKADGVFAVKITYDTWWDEPDGATGFDNRGTYTNWVLQTVELEPGSMAEVKITSEVCKEDQPPSLSDTLCKAFATAIPDDLYPKLDRNESAGTYTCLDKGPDCVLETTMNTSLNGLDLLDPDGPLPASAPAVTCGAGSGADCFPDQDGDGKPGITVTFKSGGTLDNHSNCPSQGKPYEFSFAPPSAGLAALTDTIQTVYAGTRTRLGVPRLPVGDNCGCRVVKGAVDMKDTRIADCEVLPFGGLLGTRPCEVAEADFIDSKANKALDYAGLSQGMHIAQEGDVPPAHLVIDSHAPSPGPIFRAIRLGDVGGGFTCQNVLSSQFPEPDTGL